MGGEPDGELRPIVVAGPPGCGKTTFATALALSIQYALFDLDQVTGPLTAVALSLLGQPEHALDEGPGQALRRARYASLLGAAQANVAIGRGVVVAAPFTRELAEPRAWSATVTMLVGPGHQDGGHTHATSVRLIYLDCPERIVRERLRSRGAQRDHLKLDDPGRQGRLGRNEPPRVPHIVVDGTLTTTAQVRRALHDLGLQCAAVFPGAEGRTWCSS
jgi:hypothetical protein